VNTLGCILLLPNLAIQLDANFFYIIIRLKVVVLRYSLRLWAKQKDLFVRASKAIRDCFAGNEFL
jgi:hypothetical protein